MKVNIWRRKSRPGAHYNVQATTSKVITAHVMISYGKRVTKIRADHLGPLSLPSLRSNMLLIINKL